MSNDGASEKVRLVTTISDPDDLKLVDVEKMAEILSVNKNWLYRRTMGESEAIPHYRVGRHLRFLVSEVLDFLRNRSETGKGDIRGVSYGR